MALRLPAVWLLGVVWVMVQTLGVSVAFADDRLTFVSHKTATSLPIVRRDFQRPNDGNQIFYIQRSSNANTVVYAALFDDAGTLKPKGPIHAYWRRYNTGDAVKPLKFVERRFAYGVTARQGAESGVFDVEFAALEDVQLELRQTAPGKANLWFDFNGTPIKLVYAYLKLDESGLIPKVVSLLFYGQDTSSGHYVTLTYSVAGGAIKE